MRIPLYFANISLFWLSQREAYNRQRWAGKTNWRRLRLWRGWVLQVVWAAPHWRGNNP